VVLTDFGQTVEERSKHSDTEPSDGTVLGTDSGESLEDNSGYIDGKPAEVSV